MLWKRGPGRGRMDIIFQIRFSDFEFANCYIKKGRLKKGDLHIITRLFN